MKAQTIRPEQPEQVAPFAASVEKFEAVVQQLGSASTCEMTHSEVEQLIDTEGKELMRRLLQDHLSLRARQEHERGLSGPVLGVDLVPRTHQRTGAVGMMTLFGPVQVEHTSYQMPGVEGLQPLDAMLNVPPESYSLGVSRRIALEVAKSSFEEAVTALKETTGARVPKRQLQELTVRAAVDFDEFYKRRAVRPPVLTVVPLGLHEELVVLTADGKGVVMRREALLEATRRAAEAEEHKMDKRLSKGEKKNRKRMATVAGVYTILPNPRTPEDILSDLALYWSSVNRTERVEGKGERRKLLGKKMWRPSRPNWALPTPRGALAAPR